LELFADDPVAIDRLAGLDADGLREEPLAEWRRDLDRLATGDPFDGIALYAGHVGASSLLDYFPADGLLLVEEPESVQIAVEQIDAQARELYAELIEKREL